MIFDVEAAYLRALDRCVLVQGCLVYTGPALPSGYGRVTIQGRTLYVHRLAYEHAHGPIPQGFLVDHRCHVKPCMNAEHLQLATYSQNGLNRKGPASHCKSGVRGVRYQAGYAKRWAAKVTIDGVEHVERYATLPEAAEAVTRMRAELVPARYRGKG